MASYQNTTTVTPVLQVKGLVKRFGDFAAVDGIDLAIPSGTCFGILGPNGAGKTTTFEILEGISRPTAGEVLYKGQSLGKQFRYEAGILFQETALQEFLTVREALTMFQRLYPNSVPLDHLVEQCALSTFLDRNTADLSGGQRQRVLLAIALINDPDILFLDEPTTGLDPQARRNLWQLVDNVRRAGKTILLCTHYMDEAYELCDQIVIMDKGKIIASGTPDTLLSMHFNDVVLQLPEQDIPAEAQLGSMDCKHSDGVLTIKSSDVNQTLAELLRQSVSLNNLRIRTRDLEDLFIELTGKELRV